MTQAIPNQAVAVPVIRVVFDGNEYPPIVVTDILRPGEGVEQFRHVVQDAALRTDLLERVGDWIDHAGALRGYTVTVPDNTGNILISPKAEFGE